MDGKMLLAMTKVVVNTTIVVVIALGLMMTHHPVVRSYTFNDGAYNEEQTVVANDL